MTREELLKSLRGGNQTEDIAPTPQNQGSVMTRDELLKSLRGEEIAPTEEKWYEGWFQKSDADVGGAILGTVADAAVDTGTGFLGTGESIFDFFVMLAATENRTKMMMAANDAAVHAALHGGTTDGILDTYKGMADDTDAVATEIIAADLYDEEALAKDAIASVGAAAAKVIQRQNGESVSAIDWEHTQQTRQNILDYLNNEMEDASVFAHKTDELVQSGGQMAATQTLQAVGIPWWVTTFAASAGGELENAIKQEASLGEAGLSAIISAAGEVLTEQISGGIKFGGKTLDDRLTKALARGIADKFWRAVAKAGIDIVGEGLEEVLSEDISRFGQWLTYQDEETLAEMLWSEEALEAKIQAFIGGAALGGVGSVTSSVSSAVKGVDAASGLTKNEQAVVDKVYQDELTEAAKDGKVTAKQKRALYDQILEAMEKGSISTDTIEEVLGGDSYKAYKDTVDSEDSEIKKIEAQIKKVEGAPNTVGNAKKYDSLKSKLEELKKNSNREQMQSQLSEKVSDMVKNDRLSESYAERGRRGEKFQADVSKYDAKQRATVQAAIDSGVLNNTNRAHEFVDLVAKVSADKGIPFDFTNNKKLKESGFALEGVTVNGFINDGAVTVNINSAKALNSVVGHEITHVLEGTELYEALSEAVKNYAIAKEGLKGFNKRIKATEDLYKGKNADIEAEVVSDLVGEYLFTDKAFVQRLSTENRNLFQKIFDEIKYLCRVATAGSKEARQLEKVKKIFEEAYRTETKNPTGEGGNQYSLMAFEQDGRRFVEIDQDQSRFEGHSVDEYPRIAKDIINEKFNGKVIGIDNQMFVNGSGRDEFANPSKHLAGELYEAKMRSAGELDNLLDAGTNYRNVPDGADGHYHPDAVNGFDHLDTLFKIGNRYYEAVVNIKNVKKGKLFKDVTKIKDVTQDIMDSYGDNPKFQFLRTSSMDSIRNPDEVVNTQFPKTEVTDAQNEKGDSDDIAPVRDDVNIRKSLSKQGEVEDIAPVGGYRVYAKDIMLDEGDIAPIAGWDAETEEITFPGREDLADMADESIDADTAEEGTGEAVSITTVKERLEAKQKALQTELAENQRLRDQSSAELDAKIAKLQAEYDSKTNKDTKYANNLLRRIENLKRRKAGIDADYAKRISDIESKLSKISEKIPLDHSKEDDLERKYKRIDMHLEADKKALEQEFEVRRAELRDRLDAREAYISENANVLYWELRNLKKGVRASKELGYLLDHGFGWKELKHALLTVKDFPERTVNWESAEESAVREVLGSMYENELYEYDTLDSKMQQRMEELEAQAEKEKEEAKKAQDAKRRTEVREEKLAEVRALLNSRGFDLDEMLDSTKDLSTFRMVDNTPQRALEKTFGYEAGQALADATVNRIAQNETAATRWMNTITDRANGLLQTLSDKYNIKPGSKESAAAQIYAEGFYVNEAGERIAYGDTELVKDFPDANVQKNIKGLVADARIRQFYDETLEQINESRTRNAYPEIPRREGYFLHFRAMEDTFSKMGIPFNPNDIRAKDLPTDLAGMTADLKPGQPYFSSAMRRTGRRTSYDLLGGMERYAASAKNQIFHIDDIQTLRALQMYVAERFGQAKGLENLNELSDEEAQVRIEQVYNSHLSTFASFLNTEANILAGKTSIIDRAFSEGVLGRRFLTVMDTINKQVGSNMVGYNVSSAFTNVLPVVQTFARTNKGDFVKAFAQMVSNKVAGGKLDTFVQDSPVMVRRKGSDRFSRTAWQKISDPGYALMGAVDNAATELIARTKFNEFTRKGMNEQQAHYETDKWVSRLMGDRSLGQMPQMYTSRLLGLVTKFQLEVRNQMDSQFYDTYQEAKATYKDVENRKERNAKIAAKVASDAVQLAVWQHLFGVAFEAVAGYNPAFDIIEAIITAGGWDDDDESEDTVLDNLGQGLMTLLEDMPYSSLLLGGGRIPVSAAFPNLEELITGEDEYGSEVSRLETIAEVLPYYVLPGGYGQVKKTGQGLGMYINEMINHDEFPLPGSYTDSGNLRFPVDTNPLDVAQAALFGQWASENAQQYIEEGRSPLSEKQTQELMDTGMTIQEYWDYRDGLSALNKASESGTASLSEKADYINSLDLTVAQKNILINNIADRDDPIDMTDYDQYGSFEEFDFAHKYPKKYAVSKAVGGYSAYSSYRSDINKFESDKDENGNAVSGSREQKVIDYINGLDAEYGEKIILYVFEYPSEESRDTYGYEIIDYLNNRSDISYSDMKNILEELGFTVDSKGNVTW